jgi:hypothetical protein
MSNVNIKRAIGNIRSSTTVYTPIVETIVNAIEAIEEAKVTNGKIVVTVVRSPQQETDNSQTKIIGIKIRDNGIGFTNENRESFDTLYSDYKIRKGGKGFGRFTCLKYFEEMHVDSIYLDSKYMRRKFSMGKGNDIIVGEKITESDVKIIGTEIFLSEEKGGSLNRKLSTIARSIVEVLLPYFITENYNCPEIVLTEEDRSEEIVLNDYLQSSNAVIKEISLQNNKFNLNATAGQRKFSIRTFKIFSPRNKVSKISLVAHKREVTEASIQNYIPEFSEEFFEKSLVDNDSDGRNYIIKTYVFGDYLDDFVSLERGAFEFQRDHDVIYGISQIEIETRAAELTKAAVGDEISSRQEKKRERIENYVEKEAPWHKAILKDVDIANFPVNPTDADIEALLQKEKFRREVQIKNEVSAILKADDSAGLFEDVSKLVGKISESSKNDLVHYVALRRKVLEIFKKSLEVADDGSLSSESTVHDIIFPMRADSQRAEYEDHNLWIIDERLNFTTYISSDLPLNAGKTGRPDILIYNRRIAFRAENESSNPVTIFEFKKPHRDDFANPSSKDDPIQQIVRYVNSIREGKFQTPQKRKINIAENTPFYGYIICDLLPKVENWLRTEKDFKPMPDRLGWFRWYDNINLYMEVISWEKLLNDADMRNKVFFHKLGIS